MEKKKSIYLFFKFIYSAIYVLINENASLSLSLIMTYLSLVHHNISSHFAFQLIITFDVMISEKKKVKADASSNKHIDTRPNEANHYR